MFKLLCILNTPIDHIKLFRLPLLLLIFFCTPKLWAQNEKEVSDFLDGFLSQIEAGGVTIDEQYLQDQPYMPTEMKSALRDSLQGRASFVLTKDKASNFLNDFSSTLERWGFESQDGNIRLKDNRLFDVDIKGPSLKDLFGGTDPRDRVVDDTVSVDFPVHDINSDLYQSKPASPLDLQNPSNHQQEVIYDPSNGNYLFSNKIGDEELNVPIKMDDEEYKDYSLQNSLNDYWASRSFSEEESSGSHSLLNLDLDFSSSSQLFGKGAVNIQPQGYADLTFSVKTTETDNPTISEDRRKNIYFDLDNKIQMNVLGSVGEKVKLDMNYNTEATFDFDNEFKLEFNGEEDDILKNFKAGNVSMPSVGSMITVGGSSSSSMLLPGYQELWGFQNTQQYGKLTWSWVVSQQESETKTMTLEGGATTQDFEMTVDEYDANRHFFLSHFFKDNYDKWMSYMPNVSVSGLNITKVEVWVTNKTGDFEQARNIIGFMDLGEPSAENIHNAMWTTSGVDKPQNSANTLYGEMTSTYNDIRDISEVSTVLGPLESSNNFVSGVDYEKVENARLLSSSEYTLNSTLGYISLRSSLDADEVLAVAFQYTYRGQVYQVGEFSSGSGVTSPNSLYLKLLKATSQSPSLPTWDLMMKNIYALTYSSFSQDDFDFSIVYTDDNVGTDQPYINEGNIANELLLRVMGLDTLDSSNEKGADGFFDWVDGYTVQGGNIIFPVREPFGSYLREKIGSDAIADKYVFEELYDTTLVVAQQVAEKNKFKLTGSFKSSSSSEIRLNAINIPRGSVKVTAGGTQLVENVDYTVDYNSGYLRILNEGILESGQTVTVSMEDQALFSMQKKTMLGTNLVYKFNDDLQIGASITRLSESSTTSKVSMGNDPISNTVWGLTGAWYTELPFLTKAIDKLPFTDTKAESSMTVRGELAQLIAGHDNSIGESGSVYVDDFESTTIGINIQNYYAWDISSVPARFPESELSDDVEYGFNRAKLAWYSIDRMMQENTSQTPSNIKNNDEEQSNHYVRSVNVNDLFPNEDQDFGESTYVPVLNIAYYPDEKGPYNYDTDLDEKGRLNDPASRWAGITRKLETTNFESSNIGYIEFWMMDPFIYDKTKSGGEVCINLGNISEDVLKDGRKAFENGLPATSEVTDVDSTAWGRVSTKQSLVNAFDNNESARQYQDLGLDGLNNDDERSFFSDYVDQLEALKSSTSTEYQSYIDSLILDPSQDDYHYFRGSDYDAIEAGVLERYKHYNNHQGNSPSALDSDESYSTAGKSTPDGEDINQDFTLSESDSYYEYSFNVSPSDTVIGENYIVDSRTETVELANGNTEEVKWYQYRIPVQDYDPSRTVGSISDFTSIRFMRMYLTGFEDPIVMRLANMELVRNEWRSYGYEIEPDVYDELSGELDIEAVNYEENSDRSPVNYVLPPEVTRMTDPSQPTITQLNEQSMVLRVNNLAGRDSRAAYKVMQMDFRQYENLQMWVHAEALPLGSENRTELEDGDLALFIRLGSDYNDNYYEYELPLYLTPEGYYDGDDEDDRYIVWPAENRMDIDLDLFTDLKLQRNENDISYTETFTQVVDDEPEQSVSMKGNPSLSDVSVIMIGVRNTKSKTTDYRSAEIWVNELRLNGFEEDGGWAGTGSMTVKIADIGSASASGTFTTTGWGTIEQTLMERQLEDNTSFDVSTSLELGKLLPRKAKIQMPMYYAYSKTTSKPKYDPLNQDLLLQDQLDAADSQDEQDSILSATSSYEKRKSINFSNVKVNVSGKKKHFYDPANLSFSYAFTETESQDETVEREIQRERDLGVNYSFSPSPKPIEPFKKIEALNADYLALIRDFNFYLKPTKLAFSSTMNRSYYEQQNRDLSSTGYESSLLVSKDIYWNSSFSLNYKLAQSLSFDYSAKTYAVVDEDDWDWGEDGELISIRDLNDKMYSTQYEAWKRDMLDSIMSFGRLMDYSQTFNARYNVPLSKIPLLSFISMDASYSGSYGWERGSEAFEMETDDGSTIWVDYGNTIRNTQSGSLNTSFRMSTLYNKSKYLSDISRKYGRIGGSSRKTYKTETFEQKNVQAKKGEVLTIRHKLGSKKATVKVYDADGKAIYGRKDTQDENVILFVPNENIEGGRITVSARVEDKDSFSEKLMGYTLNALMAIRNVTVNMSRDGSSTLPGFKPDNELFTANTSPGWDFALGGQNYNILNGQFFDSNYAENDEFGRIRDYYSKGWLVSDTVFSEPYLLNYGEQISARATLEPLAGLSIKLSSNYSHQESLSAYYMNGFNSFDPTTNLSRSGSFTHTWIALGTLFEKQNDEYYTSEAFERFKEYQTYFATKQRNKIYSQVNDPSYYENAEVDPNSSDVLIPAFLAAYGHKDPDLSKVSLDPKPSWRSMLPNWSVTYSGLSKSSLLKDHVKSLSLSHAYTATYSVGSYITYTDYNESDPGLISSTIDDVEYNYYQSQYDIASVTVTEGLNPLLGVDLTLKNNVEFSFSMNKLRSLSLNIASNQLIESRNDELVIGAGYRFEDLQLFVRTSKDSKARAVNNDLRLSADFSIRDVVSIIRSIDEDNVQPSSGNKVTAFNLTAEYSVNKNLDVSIFYDRQITNPVVSTSFRTMNSNFGMSFSFSLSQ